MAWDGSRLVATEFIRVGDTGADVPLLHCGFRMASSLRSQSWSLFLFETL